MLQDGREPATRRRRLITSALLAAWVTCALTVPRRATAQLERLPPVGEAPRAVERPRWSIANIAWSSVTNRNNVLAQSLGGLGDDAPDLPPEQAWTWQVIPDGFIYRAYLAGVRESRFASVWSGGNHGPLWDITLGGRAGLLRYGTFDPLMPKGWQIDLEGAAMPRLDPMRALDLQACDFRFGVPVSYSNGPWEHKFAFYHLSSHLGDELLLKDPGAHRINYSRNSLVLGNAYRWTPDLRLYAEADWAFYHDGGSKTWHFQFGAEYSQMAPTGLAGSPFAAVNCYLQQEVKYGGNVVFQTGWQWRGMGAGHLFRVGMEYFNGKSRQFEFFNKFEQQLGAGLWYDY